MEEKSGAQVFPRRDARGRVISLVELVAAATVGAVLGLAGVALIDGVFALVGSGRFGHASGWLAAILPVFLFVDDFRAWRGGAARLAVAPVAAAVGLVLGLTVAGLGDALVPLLSGAVGALVSVLVYSVVWFVGVRWLSGQGSGHGTGRESR